MSYQHAMVRILRVVFGNTPENRKNGYVSVAMLYGMATTAALIGLSSKQYVGLDDGVCAIVGALVAGAAAFVHGRLIEHVGQLPAEQLRATCGDYIRVVALPFVVVAIIGWGASVVAPP